MLSQIPIDSVPRRILPQQMMMQQGINLSPSDLAGPRENHRNYVFVDEHNRHKRLKVMRACEGCRRRKIKCDAATTNTWPCSACVRLKLHCVPPMVQYDRDFGTSNQVVLDPDHHVSYEGHHGDPEEHMMHQRLMRKSSSVGMSVYHRGSDAYRTMSQDAQHTQSHPHPQALPYSTLPTGEPIETPLAGVHMHNPVYHSPPQLRQQQQQQEQWAAPQDNGEYSNDLVGQLRVDDLKIDDTGVASYISAQIRRLAETPAYEPTDDEVEPNNPSFMPRQHEYAVKIQDTDMPSDDDIAELFSIFFNHCHPYLPIVNKAAFFRQWNTSREQISPLLLEAIFGCAGRLTLNPARGLKWIAMATKHVDCFLDVPRLSTVQALLLLLKARESAPQRGYFFRSWMSIVTIIAMARDLGLETHYDQHKQGVGCGEGHLECMTRTRVWQACFSYELMISAPQGRDKMQCNPETVDDTLPIRIPEVLDDHEYAIHSQFIHLIALQKTIRRMVDVSSKLKARPGWRNDPQFLRSAPTLDGWLMKLPQYLQVHVSVDLNDRPPQLESHFAGNLQVYYHLARMMLHRPALAYGKTFSQGGEWRHHMSECTTAAKAICRLEEVVFEQYGMLGFQCMSRGVNFSIYSLLSGAMIHLIAATCPDPEFNADAKEYFTRTMRLLENCIDNSASQEVKGQIETLREAFSVDTNRPFVLNPSFPFYNVNGVSAPVDPSLARAAYTQSETVQSTMASTSQVNYNAHPLSPAHSNSELEVKGESPAAVQSLVMLAAGQGAHAPPSSTSIVEQVQQAQWNPSRLFDNWNQAFGVSGSVTAALPTPTMSHPTQHEPSLVDPLGSGQVSSSSSSSQSIPQPQQAAHSFVSPGMWQDSVAAATVFSTDNSHEQKRGQQPGQFTFGGQNDPAVVWHQQGGGQGLRTPSTSTTPTRDGGLRDGRGSLSH